MRLAICLMAIAVSLCAGCEPTQPPVPNTTKQAIPSGASDLPNLLGEGRTFLGIGIRDGPSKIVYAIDKPGSMTCGIEYVKPELKRCIGEMGEDDEFYVIFYSSGPPVEMSTRCLVRATRHNKALAGEFIDRIVPQGETDPVESIKRAFAVGPDVIFLLTDGEFDRSIVDLTKRLNVGGKVTVHTIGFLYRGGEEVLKQIAQQNNGNYKFVSEADLAALPEK